MIEDQSNQALHLYTFYKEKVLAISGGVLEQPNKYIEMMKTIDYQVKSEQ